MTVRLGLTGWATNGSLTGVSGNAAKTSSVGGRRRPSVSGSTFGITGTGLGVIGLLGGTFGNTGGSVIDVSSSSTTTDTAGFGQVGLATLGGTPGVTGRTLVFANTFAVQLLGIGTTLACTGVGGVFDLTCRAACLGVSSVARRTTKTVAER